MSATSRVVRAAALALAVLVATPAAGAAAAAELKVVAVLPARADGVTSVVTDVQPAPSAALPADAASVRVGGAPVPASTAALLRRDAPTAVVVDASAAGARALAPTLSGVAGYLLRLPPRTPVTVTADGGAPRPVTAAPGSPASAIHVMTTVQAGGERSTTRALEVALAGLEPATAGGNDRPLVLFGTMGGPPDGEAARLGQRLGAAGAVLAVVTSPQFAADWARVAEPTGGTAVGIGRGDVAGAFDTVAEVLRARSVVSFTPPPGAVAADLSVQVGGVQVAAQVALATASVAAAPAEQAQAPAADPGPGGPQGPLVIVVVVLGVLAALVAAAAFVVRRRQAPPGLVVHDPTDGTGRAFGRPANPPGSEPSTPGVRVFDVSDPHDPVELHPLQEHRDGEVRDRSA